MCRGGPETVLTAVQDYVLKKKEYLLTQVGNPEGPDKPNKKVGVLAGRCGLL